MKISQKYLRPTSSPTFVPPRAARARLRRSSPTLRRRRRRWTVACRRCTRRGTGGGWWRATRPARSPFFPRRLCPTRPTRPRACETRTRASARCRGRGDGVFSGEDGGFARGDSTVRHRRCMTVHSRRGRGGWRSRGRRAWGWTRERFSRFEDEERWRASSRATPTEDCGSSRRREVRVATEMIRRPERPERPEP